MSVNYRHPSKRNSLHNVNEDFAHVSTTVVEISQCQVSLL